LTVTNRCTAARLALAVASRHGASVVCVTRTDVANEAAIVGKEL